MLCFILLSIVSRNACLELMIIGDALMLVLYFFVMFLLLFLFMACASFNLRLTNGSVLTTLCLESLVC